ncbi:transcriptional regulator [Thaumasiovibrio sp. DFM-14]|uniref:transcriptional regulator n=1 Tax=Thaumasiovibrio sp. DFM-14 TaxID=3384792 RepID=UPI00399FEF54
MTYTIELMEMVKARFAIESDYKLAQKLGVSRSRVSLWRNERNGMDWDVAFHIADMLGIDDQKVVINLLKDKYENPRINKVLKGVAQC